jgi:hypothetical protein
MFLPIEEVVAEKVVEEVMGVEKREGVEKVVVVGFVEVV